MVGAVARGHAPVLAPVRISPVATAVLAVAPEVLARAVDLLRRTVAARRNTAAADREAVPVAIRHNLPHAPVPRPVPLQYHGEQDHLRSSIDAVSPAHPVPRPVVSARVTISVGDGVQRSRDPCRPNRPLRPADARPAPGHTPEVYRNGGNGMVVTGRIVLEVSDAHLTDRQSAGLGPPLDLTPGVRIIVLIVRYAWHTILYRVKTNQSFDE